MTEKEKRENGQIYNPNYDEELRAEMVKAQDLCFDYNNLRPSNLEERKNQIKKIEKENFNTCNFISYNIYI